MCVETGAGASSVRVFKYKKIIPKNARIKPGGARAYRGARKPYEVFMHRRGIVKVDLLSYIYTYTCAMSIYTCSHISSQARVAVRAQATVVRKATELPSQVYSHTQNIIIRYATLHPSNIKIPLSHFSPAIAVV
jgi:hypothetical protein